MKPIVIVLIVVCVPVLAFLVLKHRKNKEARAKLAERLKQELDGLLRAAKLWQGSEHGFMSCDSDRDSDVISPRGRHFTMRQDESSFWSFYTDRRGGYFVTLLKRDTDGKSEIVFYPSPFVYSRELWLKAMIDLVLQEVRRMPPPRSRQEWSAKMYADIRAMLDRRETRRSAETEQPAVDDGALDM